MAMAPRETAYAVAVALGALVLSVLLTRLVLDLVRRWQLGQQIREDGPASHRVKQGTPSLGGLAILAAVLVAAGCTPGGLRARALYVLVLALLYGLIGLVDDLSKLRGGNTRGLPARYRLALELVLAGLFALLAGPPDTVAFGAWGFASLAGSGAGTLLWGALAVFTIVGAANAFNFADGVDGLAATLTLPCAAVMAIACAFVAPGLVWPVVALGGAAAGFLWLNSNPAKIFMGDVGSLAMGALLGGVAVAAGLELLFALAALVFVVEVLSVILQVLYFRSTGGRRLFRMTPIHHAFELRGWKEPQVVARFALVGLLAGGLALTAFLYSA